MKRETRNAARRAIQPGSHGGAADAGRHVQRLLTRELALTAGFSSALNLLVFAVPLYMMQTFDRVLPSGHLETLLLLTLMAAFALAVYAGLDIVRSRLLTRLGEWLDIALGQDLARATLMGGAAGRPGRPQVLADLASVRTMLQGNALGPLFDLPWAPVFLVAVWLLHPVLGTVALAAALALLVLTILNDLGTRTLLDAGMAAGREAQMQAEAFARNADAVIALGMAGALIKRWEARRARDRALQGRASDRAATLLALSRFARFFAQVALLGAGAWLVLRHELTPGAIIAASMLFARGLAPVEQAITSWRRCVSGWSAWRRVRSALADPGAGFAVPAVRLPRPAGALSLEAVTFRPEAQERAVVEEISFTLQPGQVCGIIGPSGAGKSTLCRLIVGALRPTEGQVRLDQASLREWRPEELGRHLGYLPQEHELFDGTVAENIARMAASPTDAVLDAARVAGVHTMILHLPAGYATRVGPAGLPLSAGQRQRIALARALYGEPALVVLDEPNANLDAAGERALIGAVRSLRARGATVLIASHKVGILGECELVAVIDQGRLRAFGPRAEVLARLSAGEPSVRAPAAGAEPSPRAAPVRELRIASAAGRTGA